MKRDRTGLGFVNYQLKKIPAVNVIVQDMKYYDQRHIETSISYKGESVAHAISDGNMLHSSVNAHPDLQINLSCSRVR